MNELEKVIAETNKSYGRDVIGFAKDMNIDVVRIPSGSLYLDWCLGGGFPLGRIIELYGPYSSGKTLLALMTIVQAQKKGLPCIFIDAEVSFERKIAEQMGIDLNKLILFQTSQGEEMFNFIKQAMEATPTGVIVVDSVAAIVPNYEEENEMDKQTMGLAARLMSKGLRLINNSNRGWSVIFINQIREKIGIMFGNPETTTGGRALGFYAGIRLRVTTGEKYEKDDKRIGQEIKFKVEKSKVSIPYRFGSIKYIYETGINAIDDMLTLALELKLVQQGGAWYTFLDERFQGKAAVEEKLRSDPEFLKKFTIELQKLIKGVR